VGSIYAPLGSVLAAARVGAAAFRVALGRLLCCCGRCSLASLPRSGRSSTPAGKPLRAALRKRRCDAGASRPRADGSLRQRLSPCRTPCTGGKECGSYFGPCRARSRRSRNFATNRSFAVGRRLAAAIRAGRCCPWQGHRASLWRLGEPRNVGVIACVPPSTRSGGPEGLPSGFNGVVVRPPPGTLLAAGPAPGRAAGSDHTHTPSRGAFCPACKSC
jgi:hypothetical protein